jgi:Domain of Unknown Function with PDB structure (DUF3862)
VTKAVAIIILGGAVLLVGAAACGGSSHDESTSDSFELPAQTTTTTAPVLFQDTPQMQQTCAEARRGLQAAQQSDPTAGAAPKFGDPQVNASKKAVGDGISRDYTNARAAYMAWHPPFENSRNPPGVDKAALIKAFSEFVTACDNSHIPIVAPNTPPYMEPPPAPANPPGMSLDEFNQIQNGMSYDQVVQIVGGPGELVSQVGSAQVYMWVGSSSSSGANANVTFYNGRVQGKAQAGLG